MISDKMLENWIYVIIILIILFSVAAALLPEAQTAGNSIQTSGLPLGTLFGGSGVVFYVIMGGLLIVIVRSLMARKK